ncbi:hypothetical protein BDV93DRAFT_515730 [Ceratobasidium sp. AG-I]|nr:hypothetical protein BDV93DRAFT_515730 [Ceratobasidium sp. AG-I]
MTSPSPNTPQRGRSREPTLAIEGILSRLLRWRSTCPSRRDQRNLNPKTGHGPGRDRGARDRIGPGTRTRSGTSRRVYGFRTIDTPVPDAMTILSTPYGRTTARTNCWRRRFNALHTDTASSSGGKSPAYKLSWMNPRTPGSAMQRDGKGRTETPSDGRTSETRPEAAHGSSKQKLSNYAPPRGLLQPQPPCQFERLHPQHRQAPRHPRLAQRPKGCVSPHLCVKWMYQKWGENTYISVILPQKGYLKKCYTQNLGHPVHIEALGYSQTPPLGPCPSFASCLGAAAVPRPTTANANAGSSRPLAPRPALPGDETLARRLYDQQWDDYDEDHKDQLNLEDELWCKERDVSWPRP